MLNPYRVSLQCRNGHTYIYELTEPGEVECKKDSCNLIINSNRVLRGNHPYIIWVNPQFQDDSNYVKTFTVIPLTSQATFVGLSTTYPINKTTNNGLNVKSYALIHQILTIDGNCLKDKNGDWLKRIGQLHKNDKQQIEKRLKYYLNLNNEPDEDWFKKNASPELLEKVFDNLSKENKEKSLEYLLNKLS